MVAEHVKESVGFVAAHIDTAGAHPEVGLTEGAGAVDTDVRGVLIHRRNTSVEESGTVILRGEFEPWVGPRVVRRAFLNRSLQLQPLHRGRRCSVQPR